MYFVDPTNIIIFFAISIGAFGFYGLMTVGYIIVNKNCGCKARGAVMGINCLSGAVGILILSKLGGYLFDNLSYYSPFVGTGLLSLILVMVLLLPPVRKVLDSEEVKQDPEIIVNEQILFNNK